MENDEAGGDFQRIGAPGLRMLQAIADSAPDLVFVKDLEGKYVFLNAAAARVKGAPITEVLGRDDRSFFDAEFAAQLMSTDREIMASGIAREVEEVPLVDGERRVFLSKKAPYRDESGRVIGLIGISRDVTEARRSAAELARAEARWQVAVDSAGDGIWDWDLITGKVFYSTRWKSMLGFDEHEVGASTLEWEQRVHPDDLEDVFAKMGLHLAGGTKDYVCDHRLRTRSGEWLWTRCRARAIDRDATGNAVRVVGVLVDISAEVAQREEAERVAAEFERLAEIDDLTGIANRRGFSRALIAAWEEAAERGGTVQLALIDIDSFKEYNDAHGHPAGDWALRALADVLGRIQSEGCGTAARYGGDEFAVVLPEKADLCAVLEAARRDLIAKGLTHRDGRPLTISCGGATGIAARTTPAQLEQEADRRLYRAKAEGRNRVVTG